MENLGQLSPFLRHLEGTLGALLERILPTNKVLIVLWLLSKLIQNSKSDDM